MPIGGIFKQTVCLVMMVKNEKDFIIPCLDSVIGSIDAWCIVDSGSTDGTQHIILDYFKKWPGVPGVLYDHRSEYAIGQRNWILNIAKGKCDYLLMIDADNIFQVDDNSPYVLQPSYRYDLTLHAYSIRKTCGDIHYDGIVHLMRSDRNWQYEGILHDYPVMMGRHGEPFENLAVLFSSEQLPGLTVIEPVKEHGPRARTAEHYYNHALILERELHDNDKIYPNLRNRYIFYLAQSYRDCGMTDRAIQAYRDRVARGGWDEEVYYSMLSIARLLAISGAPDQKILVAYLEAWNYRPSRLEAAYDLLEILAANEAWNLAAIIGAASSALQPCRDLLFLETSLYDCVFDQLYQSILQRKTFVISKK